MDSSHPARIFFPNLRLEFGTRSPRLPEDLEARPERALSFGKADRCTSRMDVSSGRAGRLLHPQQNSGSLAEGLPENQAGWSKRPAQARGGGEDRPPPFPRARSWSRHAVASLRVSFSRALTGGAGRNDPQARRPFAARRYAVCPIALPGVPLALAERARCCSSPPSVNI